MAATGPLTYRRSERAISALKKRINVAGVYLFGSQAEGHSSEWSDIDIAAFVYGLDDLDIHQRARLMSHVQAEAGGDIELNLFPAEALDHAHPASFAHYVQTHGQRLAIDT